MTAVYEHQLLRADGCDVWFVCFCVTAHARETLSPVQIFFEGFFWGGRRQRLPPSYNLHMGVCTFSRMHQLRVGVPAVASSSDTGAYSNFISAAAIKHPDKKERGFILAQFQQGHQDGRSSKQPLTSPTVKGRARMNACELTRLIPPLSYSSGSLPRE